jgi:NAD(P)-dependent dehydrogenase (short-subunit alcohol dehydrogenase family)
MNGSGTLVSGLRVLVTAGAAGIGRAIVDTFVEHGARVHICDVSSAALASLRRDQPAVGTTLADVSDEDDVDCLFADVSAQFGGLDVLVNNAGIAGPTGAIDEITTADWKRTVDINLTGQFFCARRAAPMLRATAGVLLNVSSVAGRLGYAYRTPYAATKWAIVGFSASLAKELGEFGVRVNTLLPGIVEGPRMEKVIADRATATGVSVEAMKATYLENISLKRMVSPYDVANMAVFLCSPLGRNISGQAISIDGNVVNI